MSLAVHTVASRVAPPRLGFACRMRMRRLTIQSLEQRCPMDASGVFAEFGPIAIIRSDSLMQTASIPAITCHAEESLRLPQPARQSNGRESIPDTEQRSEGGDGYGPLRPQDEPLAWGDDPADLTGSDATGSTNGTDGSNTPDMTDAPDPPEASDDPVQIGFGNIDLRPEPIRFAPPQGPTGSITVVPQAHIGRLGPATAVAGFNRTGSAQQIAGADADTKQWHSYRRSEVSLSGTRYYEPSEEFSAESAGTVHGETTTLRAISRHSMPQESGISIEGAGSAPATGYRFTRASIASVGEPESMPESRFAAIDEAHADIAIVAVVEMSRDVDAAAAREIQCQLLGDLPSGSQGEEWDQATLTSGQGADEDSAGTAAGRRLRSSGFLPDLSRWAMLGLIVSHRISSSCGSGTASALSQLDLRLSIARLFRPKARRLT